MTGRYFRFFVTMLLLLAAASPSSAARRSSLSGNLLIQDADDMFFFPHLVTMNKRLVTFDFGTSSSLGSGGMVFGTEGFTFGAFAHRSEFLGALPDAFNTVGDVANVGRDGQIGVGVGPNALNWIDVLMGWQAGDMPIGVRFSVGRGNDDPGEDDTLMPAPFDVHQDVNAFNVVVGTRFPQWGATDASLEFTIADAEEATGVTAANSLQETSPWQVSVGIRHTANEESDALTLGWLGLFSWRSGTVDQTDVMAMTTTTSSTDNTQLQFIAGAGPVYKPNDRTNVAMYGTFEYSRDQDETGGTTETHTTTVIPGWNIAAELDAASWLQFRAGLRSQFGFFSDHHEETTPPEDITSNNNFLNYDWTTGVGVRFANFQFDGYLDPTVITTGTDLLGEGSGQLFGLVTASYHF